MLKIHQWIINKVPFWGLGAWISSSAAALWLFDFQNLRFDVFLFWKVLSLFLWMSPLPHCPLQELWLYVGPSHSISFLIFSYFLSLYAAFWKIPSNLSSRLLILSVCILWINLSIEFLISITVFLICRSSIYFLLTPTWHPVYTLLHSGSEIKTSFLSLFESLLSGSVFPAVKQGVQFLSDCPLGVPVDVVVCVVYWARFLPNKGYEIDFQTTGLGRLHAPVEFKSVILRLDL